MVTQNTAHSTGRTREGARAGQIWLVAGQLVVLTLAVLALTWSPPPARPNQGMAVLLLLGCLLSALLPAWRRGEVAAVVVGVTLAFLCSLSVTRTWNLPYFTAADAEIPLMVPCVLLAACVVAGWGLLARAGIAGVSRIGRGALAAGALLIACAMLFYLVVNKAPLLQDPRFNYVVSLNQLLEEIALAVLYPLALWLGGVSIRPATRWLIAPWGLALLLAASLVRWHVR